MLIALPIVLACYGTQPCLPAATVPDRLVRSSSPEAIVSAGPREDLTDSASRPLQHAVQRLDIPAVLTLPQARRSQVVLPRGAGAKVTKGMLVLAGVVAGCYAGGHLGAAMDDSPDDGAAFLGMPIGAALGGWIVWNLVR